MRKNGVGVWSTNTFALLVIAAAIGFLAGVADVMPAGAGFVHPSDFGLYTYPDNQCSGQPKDPVNIVFVRHGFPSVIRDHADVHGGWEKNPTGVQYFSDQYGCFAMDDASASRNSGSRFHMRYYNNRVRVTGQPDEIRTVSLFSSNWGSIASAAAHHEDLVACGLPPDHSVDDDSDMFTIKGKTVHGGFNRGREDIRKNWVPPNADHILVDTLNWDNIQSIVQCQEILPPFNQQVASSDGLVYYIQAFDLTDRDADGCPGARENLSKANANRGGGRSPFNPWDFYDVAIAGGLPGKDGVIDLPNDILSVIQRFAPGGGGNEWYDRGPSSGPNAWNMTAPDGVIDLPNDLLGVILQFGHNCVS